jgi:hypothetical protein
LLPKDPRWSAHQDPAVRSAVKPSLVQQLDVGLQRRLSLFQGSGDIVIMKAPALI